MGVADNPFPQGAWQGLESPPEMDDRQFDKWTTLLRARTGMKLTKERKSFLVTSLNLRMREIGQSNYETYYQYLQEGRAGKLEWTALVDRLTVHETRFFRDQKAILFFKEICKQRLEQGLGEDGLQIWSAGCSTGEEPYSLSMVLDGLAEEIGKQFYYGITATDISLLSLATAKRGIYKDRSLVNIESEYRDKYFDCSDDGQYKINQSIKGRICFAQMNILDCATARLGKLDIIFCQNLLIYFDQKKRSEILNGMVIHLKPGGILILGPGEVIEWNNPLIERVKNTQVLAFRRVE